MSYTIRSGRQHDILVAISLIEKARYLAEASQQLSYDVLRELLPVFIHNISVLRSVRDYDDPNYFIMDLSFCTRACLMSYEKLIRVIESSRDDASLFENICRENDDRTLSRLCDVMDSIWKRYWLRFHVNEDKIVLLRSIENELVAICSSVCIRGNEHLPEGFRCFSCLKNSAYLKTGITDECCEKEKACSNMNYCAHFIQTDEKSKYYNINRAIFERRLNETGTSQQ